MIRGLRTPLHLGYQDLLQRQILWDSKLQPTTPHLLPNPQSPPPSIPNPTPKPSEKGRWRRRWCLILETLLHKDKKARNCVWVPREEEELLPMVIMAVSNSDHGCRGGLAKTVKLGNRESKLATPICLVQAWESFLLRQMSHYGEQDGYCKGAALCSFFLVSFTFNAKRHTCEPTTLFGKNENEPN
ncbi:hypothetical protein E2542_SST15250 [Spatholobus suberectus]|nr:hypothetical protein E2542_SST15250 [Spatholobus suberectus]